jgi:hypothetical protein
MLLIRPNRPSSNGQSALHHIKNLKTCPPLLPSPRYTADVARSRAFDHFTKKPSKFLEITKKFSKLNRTATRSNMLQPDPRAKLYF